MIPQTSQRHRIIVSSIQLEGIGTFWSIVTFWLKKSCTKIQKSLLNYTNSSCINFNQNVPITPNCILPRHSSTKFFNFPILYTIDTFFYSSSINFGSISFYSSSDIHKPYHLLGCHTTGLNCLFNFLKLLCFLQI